MPTTSRWDPQEDFSPREHHEWCIKMWRRMDRDDSGYITLDELHCKEFRCVLKKVIAPDTGNNMGGPRYARAQMSMDQAVSFLMRKADMNDDSMVSFQEFKSFMQTLRIDHGEFHTANLIWALFDLDTDGFINEIEFREILRFYLGHDATESQFQEEWALLDCAGRGKVTKELYVSWLRLSEHPVLRCHAPPTANPAASALDGGAAGWDELPPAEARRDGGDQWRPWHSYKHLAFHEPTKGKPNQMKMKFRDCSKTRSQTNLGSDGSPKPPSSDLRPDWNQHLATSHPNWPDKHGKPRRVVTQRHFFQRTQSLPELRRHLESRPGLRDHTEALFGKDVPKKPPQQVLLGQDSPTHASYTPAHDNVPKKPTHVTFGKGGAPQATFGKDVLKKPSTLSYEHEGGASQLLSIASRSKPAGYMRHHSTRERKTWNEAWFDPPQLKDLYFPAPVTNIGPPARHLFADLYEDEA
mmetsp:Transcript_163673/g.524869  ORF Transcript_163673/g.524869 Transcript_163673/m.524869 type:complete len:468 (+) Transcript_163673:79-1482(+)